MRTMEQGSTTQNSICNECDDLSKVTISRSLYESAGAALPAFQANVIRKLSGKVWTRPKEQTTRALANTYSSPVHIICTQIPSTLTAAEMRIATPAQVAAALRAESLASLAGHVQCPALVKYRSA